jgi:hypothetical protein
MNYASTNQNSSLTPNKRFLYKTAYNYYVYDNDQYFEHFATNEEEEDVEGDDEEDVNESQNKKVKLTKVATDTDLLKQNQNIKPDYFPAMTDSSNPKVINFDEYPYLKVTPYPSIYDSVTFVPIPTEKKPAKNPPNFDQSIAIIMFVLTAIDKSPDYIHINSCMDNRLDRLKIKIFELLYKLKNVTFYESDIINDTRLPKKKLQMLTKTKKFLQFINDPSNVPIIRYIINECIISKHQIQCIYNKYKTFIDNKCSTPELVEASITMNYIYPELQTLYKNYYSDVSNLVKTTLEYIPLNPSDLCNAIKK